MRKTEQPTVKEIKKWVRALDSGKYKQGKAALQTGKDSFCCLGVACKVFIPAKLQKLHNSFLIGSMPSQQAHAPHWLEDINTDFRIKTGTDLVTINDTVDSSFAEIATLLELVYVHKILD